MSIQKTPRWNDQELTPEPASPFLSEEIFNTASDVPEERATEQTWYQFESPFLYAFELKDQEVIIEREAEGFEVDTDEGALAEDLVDEPEVEEEAADTDFSTNEPEEGEAEELAELDEARYDEEIDPKEDEELEESALQEEMGDRFSRARETRELTHLGLHEYQVDPPVQKIDVRRWSRSLSVPVIRVTAGATPGDAIEGSEKQGVHQLDFDKPVRMWIRAGEGGKVAIKLKIEYKGHDKPRYWSKVAEARFAIPSLPLCFRCTPEGDIRLVDCNRSRPVTKTATRRLTEPDRALSVDIEVYQRRDKPRNSPMRDIPSSVWEAWMKQFCILRIVIIAKLTVSENGPGWYSITVNDGSVPLPDPFKADATGDRTARLGPMTIDLVPEGARPPLKTPHGMAYRVCFGVGSSEIDTIVNEGPKEGSKHQGNALDAWIRDEMMARWDVREALLRGFLPVRGEARASATFKGRGGIEALRRYNQALSKERLVAVVNRLQRTIAGLTRDRLLTEQIKIEAIGARKAPKLGEETVDERCVTIIIDGADLDKAIKELYKAPSRWWWER